MKKIHIFIKNPPGTCGIIARVETGVIYQQQCGGMACDQREEEGFYAPIELLSAPLHDAVHRHDCCWGTRLSGPCLDDLEKLIAGDLVHPVIDRTRDGYEAWVPILVGGDLLGMDNPGQGAIWSAWLVWENCD